MYFKPKEGGTLKTIKRTAFFLRSIILHRETESSLTASNINPALIRYFALILT